MDRGCLGFFLPYILVCISTLTMASPAYFEDARRAASEGCYQNVVEVLSVAIDDQSLDPNNLADAFSNRGIAYSLLKDYTAAIADLNKAIELNPAHLLALNHLGTLAQQVEKNDVTAASWYQKAAQLGHAASQVKLGNLHREGRGVAMSPAMAVALYTNAEKQEYSAAYVPLAEMYLKGWGTEVNYQRAVELLHLGITEGRITGRYFLGRVYENGWGAEQDLQKAITQYRQAAFQGFAPVQ
jgi:TPR repeat protein